MHRLSGNNLLQHLASGFNFWSDQVQTTATHEKSEIIIEVRSWLALSALAGRRVLIGIPVRIIYRIKIELYSGPLFTMRNQIQHGFDQLLSAFQKAVFLCPDAVEYLVLFPVPASAISFISITSCLDDFR